MPVPVQEVDVNRIDYIQRCYNCGAQQAVLKDGPPQKRTVDLEEGFVVPPGIEIEESTPRWCNKCDDETRFINR